MLGMFKNTFTYRGVDLWKILYTVYIRPLLEFANSCWSPPNKREQNMLEQVQRRPTRIPLNYQKHSYEDRLLEMGLDKLKERRLDSIL